MTQSGVQTAEGGSALKVGAEGSFSVARVEGGRATWPRVPIRIVAPATPSSIQFEPDEGVWHLTLDQIESDTGRVTNPRMVPSCEAGASTYTFDDGNVLYSKLRPYLNKVVRPNGLGIATTELVPLRPRPELLVPDFLAYYLRAPRFVAFASSCTVGTKMPRVIMSRFWEHEVPLPPLSEQRRIVEILDQADHLRRLRAEADAKADRILPALFIKMFGNPGNHGPERLDALVDIGGPLVEPSRTEYLDLPHVGGEHIEKGTGRLLPAPTVRQSRLRSRKFFFAEQHVLYCKIRPYLNKVAFPRQKGLCSADIYPLLPRDRRLGPWYLTALLRSEEFLMYARGQSDRLRMPKLNREQLGAYLVTVPSSELLAAFERRGASLDAMEAVRCSAVEEIARLFAILLQRAFRGDLTASWRRAHMSELLQEMEHQATVLAEAR